jgi:protein-S-isoprenylcysteine O-methyltransferase Ste14
LIALTYHLASRLAYVLYIGLALTRQERSASFTLRHGPDGGFRRFRRVAATLMYNDAASFVWLCIASRQTLRLDVAPGSLIVVGAVLVVVGLGVKLWAAVSLGAGAYYWRDFFLPVERQGPPGGPYPFLKNPMYTVGYLPAYGCALVTASLPALIAAAVDQAAILGFYHWVEKPHVEKMLTS